MSRLWLVILAAVLLSGCAVPGAPQPPSLGIPKPVDSLKAERTGNTVNLTWTAPNQTSDGALIKHAGKMVVYRSVGAQKSQVAELALPPALKSEQVEQETARDDISALIGAPAADFAVYTVDALSASGKSAGSSNQAQVPLVPVGPAPSNLVLNMTPAGVGIHWQQSWPPENKTHLTAQYATRIFRREEGTQQPVMVAELGPSNQAMAVIDRGIEWQKNYEYWITPVTLWQQNPAIKGEVQGESSPTVSILADDKFPPAVPTGLQAVYSATPGKLFIDLTWTPNADADLAGYNVYRLGADGQWTRINTDPARTPTFRDEQVRPGSQYTYSVTAVDQRGNESDRSQPASESIPAQP